MSVGIWCNIIQAYPHAFMSTGLEHVPEEKDLGLIIDSKLTSESHIEAKLGTANQMSGLLRRSFTLLFHCIKQLCANTSTLGRSLERLH